MATSEAVGFCEVRPAETNARAHLRAHEGRMNEFYVPRLASDDIARRRRRRCSATPRPLLPHSRLPGDVGASPAVRCIVDITATMGGAQYTATPPPTRRRKRQSSLVLLCSEGSRAWRAWHPASSVDSIRASWFPTALRRAASRPAAGALVARRCERPLVQYSHRVVHIFAATRRGASRATARLVVAMFRAWLLADARVTASLHHPWVYVGAGRRVALRVVAPSAAHRNVQSSQQYKYCY